MGKTPTSTEPASRRVLTGWNDPPPLDPNRQKRKSERSKPKAVSRPQYNMPANIMTPAAPVAPQLAPRQQMFQPQQQPFNSGVPHQQPFNSSMQAPVAGLPQANGAPPVPGQQQQQQPNMMQKVA